LDRKRGEDGRLLSAMTAQYGDLAESCGYKVLFDLSNALIFLQVLALINGVKKFGEGRWTEILKTAPFKSSLGDRDRESIKDKYRQLKEQAYRQQNE